MKALTKSPAKKAAPKKGAATAGGAEKGAVHTRDLQAVAQSLHANLQELENEYQRLSKELAEKKEARAAAGETADDGTGERLRQLQTRIEKSGLYVQKQQAFLQKIRAFHDRNERLLADIAARLAGLEQGVADGSISPESQAGVRDELLTMLGELRAMRERREALVRSINS